MLAIPLHCETKNAIQLLTVSPKDEIAIINITRNANASINFAVCAGDV